MAGITRRDFGLAAAAGTLSTMAPRVGTAQAAGPSQTFDPLSYVNPELRALYPMLKQATARAPLSNETLAAARASSFPFPPLAAPAFAERMIPGGPGAPDVRIYVINAGTSSDTPKPAILHMHGGGFILGDAKTSVHTLQEIALALNCVIVTVDYRLAPETRFPGSLEDNYAGLKWLYTNANDLGVDRNRIAVMGESAGGGHAAMLAIAARDRGEIPVIYQALIYPMLDDRTGSTRHMPPYMGMVIWTADDNRYGWTSLLGIPAGSAHVPRGAVPARVEDLRGLPPTFIGVGSIDLFADEDIDYARRLLDAGIPTELHVVPGAFHGFDGIPGTKLSAQFRTTLIAALTQGLNPAAWPARPQGKS